MDRPKEREYWKPGDPLTEEDKKLLAPIIRKANALGYTPSQSDMNEAREINRIKRRFRTWGNAIKAADLPWVNYSSQQKSRASAKKTKKPQPKP
jgi:hypothetical protein